MKTLIIEHVELANLPAAWRAHLPLAPNTRVTVRIDEEQSEDQRGTSPLGIDTDVMIFMMRDHLFDSRMFN
jgi:hypothetical protein